MFHPWVKMGFLLKIRQVCNFHSESLACSGKKIISFAFLSDDEVQSYSVVSMTCAWYCCARSDKKMKEKKTTCEHVFRTLVILYIENSFVYLKVNAPFFLC